MKLYRRTNSPYYWYDITVDGKRTRASTLRTSKVEARAVADAALREALDRSQLGVREEPLLSVVIDRYLADPSVRRQRDYRNVISRANKLLGAPHVTEGAPHVTEGAPNVTEGRYGLEASAPFHHAVTTSTLSALVAARLTEGNAPSTINREISLVQAVYNKARRDWGYRVADDVRWPKHREQHKLRYLSLDEERALLHELDPQRSGPGMAPPEARSPELQRKLVDQYDLVVFLLDTGCRYSEATHTTRDCYTRAPYGSESGSINLYRSKVGNASTLRPTARLREVLDRRLQIIGNSPYLFPSPSNPDKPRGHATKGIMKAYERAGLNEPHKVERFGRATVHTLRHTFASRLVEANLSLYKVQALLGHSTSAMTQRYATLRVESASDEAAGILDALHGSTPDVPE